jgi:EAL domain-containing protein (putative c-di-GMP-specific phosphodiesterase class I)
MLTDVDDGILVRSVVDLGHNLGLTVVAEGVEDQATMDALSALGCDIAQGFHLGRPMTVEAFGLWRSAREAMQPASR